MLITRQGSPGSPGSDQFKLLRYREIFVLNPVGHGLNSRFRIRKQRIKSRSVLKNTKFSSIGTRNLSLSAGCRQGNLLARLGWLPL